jgi:hypothetical protein
MGPVNKTIYHIKQVILGGQASVAAALGSFLPSDKENIPMEPVGSHKAKDSTHGAQRGGEHTGIPHRGKPTPGNGKKKMEPVTALGFLSVMNIGGFLSVMSVGAWLKYSTTASAFLLLL